MLSSATLILFLSVTLVLLAPQYAFSATCSALTGLSCEKTDFTLETCEDNVCACKAGYVPIRSGCAKSIEKPTVTVEKGRTKEVSKSKEVKLHCSTAVPTCGVAYEWKKNGGVIPGTKESVYIFMVNDKTDVGNFSCVARYTSADCEVLDSEESDEISIVFLDASSTKSSAEPQMSNLPSHAASGAILNPFCENIPIGALALFAYDNDSVTIDSDMLVSAPIVFNTTAQSKTTIRCVLNPLLGDTEGAHEEMTKVAFDIDSATLVVDGAVGNEYVYKTGTPGPNLTCVTSPAAEYMTVENKTITYTIEDSQRILPVAGATYTPSPTAGNHVILCKAAYGDNPVKTSAPITITFSDDYITDAVLKASGTKLLPGSRLVLTCGSAQNGVTYNWTKDSAVIELQKDRIIQFDNVTEADKGEYTCWATRNNYVNSSSVSVTIESNIATPVIEEMQSASGRDYELKCVTESATVGMTYAWTKDTTDLNTMVSIHKITAASPEKDSGNYTCVASFNGETSSPSARLEIVVEARDNAETIMSSLALVIFTTFLAKLA